MGAGPRGVARALAAGAWLAYGWVGLAATFLLSGTTGASLAALAWGGPAYLLFALTVGGGLVAPPAGFVRAWAWAAWWWLASGVLFWPVALWDLEHGRGRPWVGAVLHEGTLWTAQATIAAVALANVWLLSPWGPRGRVAPAQTR